MKLLYAFGSLVLLSTLTATPAAGLCDKLFESEQAAVIAAADIYNPLSIREDREYMGTIFKSGNQFGYTVTPGRKGADSVDIRIPRVDWDNVIAFWHTHGDAARHHRYFSDIDTSMVKKFGKPFYLADYTGFLKVFKSGDKTMPAHAANRIGLPSDRGYAIGEFVRDRFNRTVRINTRSSAVES